MSKTISDRLAQVSKTSFVGRKAEFNLLLNTLESEELPFQVAFIHGMGGIGKTHLVKALINTLNREIQVIFLDCRNIEPTSKGLLTAFCNEAGYKVEEENELNSTIKNINENNLRTLIVLDTYETFGLMDTWLRQTFIPSLSQNVFTIIISRQPPNSAWITTPGWDSLVKVLKLDALSEEESYEMLESRGLNQSQSESINSFARGYPLAIELAAEAFKSKSDLKIDSAPPPKVLQGLTNSFLTGLTVELKKAVEASSTTRRLSETLLKEILGSEYHRHLFDKLLELPFVNPTTDGLIVHDLVRDTIRNDLEKRDPERLRSYRTRAWRHFTNESLYVTSQDLWQYTADLLYLIQNPALRDGFFPKEGLEHSIERASLKNKKDIIEIANTYENKEAVNILEQLLDSHLEFFSVALNRNGDVDGFFILFQPHEIDSELASKDPITSEYFRHLEENPVSENERVLILRRWLSIGNGELPSNCQAACWIDVKRKYMELRPELRRLYTSVTDLQTWGPIVTPLGFVPLPNYNVKLGDTNYNTALLDFGPLSIDGWLKRIIGLELGKERPKVEHEIPVGTANVMFADIANSTDLTEKLGDAAFRARARELFATSVAIINEYGGNIIEGKLLGDGVLAVFNSTHSAIECALQLNLASTTNELQLHIGLNAGDVIKEDNNIYGGTVNLAARIAGSTNPGEILVSDTIRNLAKTSTNVKFNPKGEYNLKGISEPHQLYSVISN